MSVLLKAINRFSVIPEIPMALYTEAEKILKLNGTTKDPEQAQQF